jgi:hypothetical protein
MLCHLQPRVATGIRVHVFEGRALGHELIKGIPFFSEA